MDDNTRWHILTGKKWEIEISEAFRYLRQYNIEPILIKGWAAARSYPADVPRYFDDVDLAVRAADYEAARTLVRTGGRGLRVDIHREFRHLDTRSWNEVYNDSKLLPLNGTEIRIPSAEDHLRILCVHWLNDGGAKKDRLWDIFYAVKNRPSDFDWNRCLNSVSEKRQRWIIATKGMAHKYLQLEIDDLPFADQARVPPSWLIREVEREWKNGVQLRSLSIGLKDRKEFMRQIRKRIPPNAVEATIEMEGSFDNGLRLYYQLGSMVKRAIPSIKGLFRRVAGKS